MSLTAKIQADIRHCEQIIETLEKRHAEKMKRARNELANLRKLLGMAEGIEQ